MCMNWNGQSIQIHLARNNFKFCYFMYNCMILLSTIAAHYIFALETLILRKSLRAKVLFLFCEKQFFRANFVGCHKQNIGRAVSK